jgi:hypothetical protein
MPLATTGAGKTNLRVIAAAVFERFEYPSLREDRVQGVKVKVQISKSVVIAPNAVPFNPTPT